MKKKLNIGLLIFFTLLFHSIQGYALVGDMNGSGTVDGDDLALFSLTFGADKNSPMWTPGADFAGNGFVDGDDLSSFAPNFGLSSVGSIAAKVIWREKALSGDRLRKPGFKQEKVFFKPENISTVLVEVTGPNMSTVSQEFLFSAKNGMLSDVPAGSNRTLTISGKNAAGTAIFRGMTTIIIFENSTTHVSLYATEVSLVTKRSPLLSAGDDQSLTLTSDGIIWGWGLNIWGQLGDGTIINSPVPVRSSQLTELIGVVDINTGFDNAVALKYDGTVWSWGYNDFGQLGNGEIGDKLDNYTTTALYEISPVPVMANSTTTFGNVTTFSAGGYHVLAVKTDGSVWSWGHNSDGQLGINGTTPNSKWPIDISLASVQSVTAGAFHSVALKSDGTVWTWGMNEQGQLGDGNAPTKNSTPFEVFSGVKSVAAGYYHTVVLRNDSTVWAWGDRDYGQVGNGTFGDGDPLPPTTIPDDVVDSPVPVSINNVIAIAAGGHHTLALKADGTVWAWGSADFGQLGDGTVGDANDLLISPGDFQWTPVQVKGSGGIGFLTDVVAIEAGFRHSLAITLDGTVWAWGENEFGQLGDNNPGDGVDNPASKDISIYPVQVLNVNVN